MFKKIKAAYREFAHDKPGSRFIHLHREWARKSKGPWVRVLAVAVGVILIVAGILLGLVPGVPGIVLGILGFALIAAQFRGMAAWCDRVEIWGRGAVQKKASADGPAPCPFLKPSVRFGPIWKSALRRNTELRFGRAGR